MDADVNQRRQAEQMVDEDGSLKEPGTIRPNRLKRLPVKLNDYVVDIR